MVELKLMSIESMMKIKKITIMQNVSGKYHQYI